MSLQLKISEELYNEVLENGYTLKAILLKSEGLTKFTSLYITEFEDYISEEFLKVFRIVRKYRGSIKNEDIYISFLFMPFSDKIDHDCLTADGYFLRYEAQQQLRDILSISFSRKSPIMLLHI